MAGGCRLYTERKRVCLSALQANTAHQKAQLAKWTNHIPVSITESWADPTDMSGYIPDATIRRWCIERVVPQPIKTLTQPLSLTNPRMPALPHRHIVCTQGRPTEEDLAVIREAIEQQGGSYRELASHHLCVWVAPGLVATALQEALE